MPTYRVTYTDSVLRVAVIQADNPDHAETLVREQMECGQHHHAVDAWNDDWQAEPHTEQPSHNQSCFECNQPLK